MGFETPTWIEHQGKLVEELTFSRLFRTISRRLTTLCALYEELGEDHEEEFARLDEIAGAVRTMEPSLRRLTAGSGDRKNAVHGIRRSG